MLTRLARLGLCVAAATAAFVGSTWPADATQGFHRELIPETGFDVSAASCGFPVQIRPAQVHNNAGQYIIHQSTLADGSTYLQITGKLVLRATNTDTGKAVQFIAGGTQKLVISPDGSSFSDKTTGHLIWSSGPADQAKFGIPGLLLGTGHGNFAGNNTGLTSWAFTGHITDMCAELA